MRACKATLYLYGLYGRGVRKASAARGNRDSCAGHIRPTRPCQSRATTPACRGRRRACNCVHIEVGADTSCWARALARTSNPAQQAGRWLVGRRLIRRADERRGRRHGGRAEVTAADSRVGPWRGCQGKSWTGNRRRPQAGAWQGPWRRRARPPPNRRRVQRRAVAASTLKRRADRG